MLNFTTSYQVLIKIPYFTDSTERGIAWKEGLGGERRPKDRVK
jgi:hypothetical protein